MPAGRDQTHRPAPASAGGPTLRTYLTCCWWAAARLARCGPLMGTWAGGPEWQTSPSTMAATSWRTSTGPRPAARRQNSWPLPGGLPRSWSSSGRGLGVLAVSTVAGATTARVRGTDGGGRVAQVEWNRLGTTLATSGDDGVVRLWRPDLTDEWHEMAAIVGGDG